MILSVNTIQYMLTEQGDENLRITPISTGRSGHSPEETLFIVSLVPGISELKNRFDVTGQIWCK